MKGIAYRMMLDLHSWLGVAVTWVLLAIFISGAFSLFHGKTNRWELPELVSQPEISTWPAPDIPQLLANVEREFEGREITRVGLFFPTEHSPRYEAHVDGPTIIDEEIAFGIHGELLSSPQISQPIDILFDLHWRLLMGNFGVYLAGFAAFLMMVGIVSGVVIHWRKLWPNLFFLREAKSPRRYWLDVHNILGVSGIPFQLMIAFTGAFFNLLFIYQVIFGLALFQGDQEALLAAVGLDRPALEMTNASFDHAGLSDIYQQQKQAYPHEHIHGFRISNYGDENAIVRFFTDDTEGLHSQGSYYIHIASGEVLKATSSDDKSPIKAMTDTIVGLHFGNYGGALILAAYFVLSLATVVVILSGVVVWLSKNEKSLRGTPWFNYLLRRTTLGFTLGLCVASALLMASCHVLPLDINNRVSIQKNVFLVSWLALTFTAYLPFGHRALISGLSVVAACACLTAVLAHGFNTQHWLWWSATNGYWDVFWVDMTALMFALVFVLLAKNMWFKRV